MSKISSFHPVQLATAKTFSHLKINTCKDLGFVGVDESDCKGGEIRCQKDSNPFCEFKKCDDGIDPCRYFQTCEKRDGFWLFGKCTKWKQNKSNGRYHSIFKTTTGDCPVDKTMLNMKCKA